MAPLGPQEGSQESPANGERNLAPSRSKQGPGQGPRPVGDRYALLVGINRYIEPTFTSLRYCVNDVKALAARLRELDYTVVTMHDEVAEDYHRPRRDDVLSELDRLCAQVKEDDLLTVYLACHGVLEGGKTLLLMQDTRRSLLRERSLPLSLVEQALRGSKARRKVLLLDACHSGVDIGRAMTPESEGAELLKHAYELAEGFALLASSTAQQAAQEWREQQHGVFTYFLLKGLAGEADLGIKGVITVDDLKAYLVTQLRRWSIEHGGLLQEPTARTEGTGSIILADLRGEKSPPAKSAPAPLSGSTLAETQVTPPTREPAAPPPPPLNAVIRFCARTEQWQSLEQIAEQKSFRLVFLPGPDGEAHDYFVQRLLAWESSGRFLLRRVAWRHPQPPQSQADYLASLAEAVGCPRQDVQSLSAHLTVLCQERQLLLLHPLLYERFTEQALRDYYTNWWRELEPPAAGVLCMQPVAWERAGSLRRRLARLLGQAWFYPSDWVRRGATDIQAQGLMRQIKRSAPARVHLLKELAPLTASELMVFCENQGLDEQDRAGLIRKVLEGSPDSKVTLDRLMEYLARRQ